MVFITDHEILETVNMIRSENLDVRAVTMGISLDDCSDRDPHKVAECVHDKIVTRARRLVEVAAEIQENAWNIVPLLHFGQWIQPMAHRKNVKGFLKEPGLLVFWNVEKT